MHQTIMSCCHRASEVRGMNTMEECCRKAGEKLRDPKKQNRGPGKRNRVNNRFRAGVFRRCYQSVETLACCALISCPLPLQHCYEHIALYRMLKVEGYPNFSMHEVFSCLTELALHLIWGLWRKQLSFLCIEVFRCMQRSSRLQCCSFDSLHSVAFDDRCRKAFRMRCLEALLMSS